MSMKNPTHPGAGIRDDPEELGWTVSEAARRMGVRRENLSLVIHGQVGTSPKMALALERVGISNAEFWMRRQTGYELPDLCAPATETHIHGPPLKAKNPGETTPVVSETGTTRCRTYRDTVPSSAAASSSRRPGTSHSNRSAASAPSTVTAMLAVTFNYGARMAPPPGSPRARRYGFAAGSRP